MVKHLGSIQTDQFRLVHDKASTIASMSVNPKNSYNLLFTRAYLHKLKINNS